MSIQLNEEQECAAVVLDGAVLVTAGAGSGKTRLLTQRIANLVASGVTPRNILCITFTNKAAAEMKTRLSNIVDTSDMWIMTFHAMCLKMLRFFGSHVSGYTNNFVIYAEAEKERVLKRLIADRELESDKYLKKAKFWISDCKNTNVTIEDYCLERDDEPCAKMLCEIMMAYKAELCKNDAMDFDDLLTNCYTLLSTCPDVLARIQDRFLYISVDEFQDTNRLQYDIVVQLAKKYGNIFVVGDEDQSIYGWRGANIQNIFDFVKDFKAKTFKLERNYRSTSNILATANAIIAHNTTRLDKKLWTDKGDGARIEKYVGRDEGDEAEYVVRSIDSLVRMHNYKYSDCAVLMRLNALTRPFEERLLAYNINYSVFGGFKFFERKEVKDILAYLRMLSNPRDDEAVCRIINVPKRGIGDGALAQLRNYCAINNLSLNDCCREISKNEDLGLTLIRKITSFSAILNSLTEKVATSNLEELIRAVIEESGYRSMLAVEDTEEFRSKRANLDELVASVAEHMKMNPTATLQEYLESVALMSDLDSMDETRNAVTLATVHAVKGLEFKVIFVVGLDDGIFPIRRDGSDDMEEERRLMYVAVTRAEERLYLTRAYSRFLYGKRDIMAPSRFLGEDGSPVTLAAALNAVTPSIANRHSLPMAPTAVVPKPNSNPEDYPVGTVVMHKAFGRGVVKGIIPLKDVYILTIQFDSVGNKNLGLGLVQLDIVT